MRAPGRRSGWGRGAALAALACLWILHAGCRPSAEADDWYTVVQVNDGDTVVLGGGQKRSVRYLGIDAPETGCRGQAAEPFAAQAREANRALVFDRRVRLASATWSAVIMTALTDVVHVNSDWSRVSIDDLIERLETVFAEFTGLLGNLRLPV